MMNGTNWLAVSMEQIPEIRDYEITYYRPEPENADVRWIDNQGNEGYVYRNTFSSAVIVLSALGRE